MFLLYFLFVFSFFFLHKRACRKTGAAQKASASAPAGKDAYRIQRNWLAPIVVVYLIFGILKKYIYVKRERGRIKRGAGGYAKQSSAGPFYVNVCRSCNSLVTMTRHP